MTQLAAVRTIEERKNTVRETRQIDARGRKGKGEDGFALILAILALMLLTFLGLTLAATTSTELQIATNYRWSQQAFYNAEAGVESAKIFLRRVPTWSNLLPVVRAGQSWTWDVPASQPATPAAPAGTPTVDPTTSVLLRHWENSECDARGAGVGFGVVMNDPGSSAPEGPFQYRSNLLGRSLNGAVTMWVRRGVIVEADGQIRDDPSDQALVLTTEGVAPFTGAAMAGAGASTRAQANAAVRVLEVSLTRASNTELCEGYRGQAGGGISGSGFSNCSTLKDTCSATGNTGSLGAAVGNTARGRGNLVGTNTTNLGSGAAGGLCDQGVD